MATHNVLPNEEATTLLEKLTPEERDYVLDRLVSAKFESKQNLTRVPIYRPDGTVFGFVEPPTPPTVGDMTTMNNRARRVDPGVGRPTNELFGRPNVSNP